MAWNLPSAGMLPLGGGVVLYAALSLAQSNSLPPRSVEHSREAQGVATVSAEGRLVSYPGAEVRVAADYTGIVATVDFSEDSAVRAGDILARIRADETEAALAAVRARVAELAAEVKLTASELARAERLEQAGNGSAQNADRARRDLEIARARHGTARAEVARVASRLEKATVRAPIDGIVIERFVNPGEAIRMGGPIATLVDFSRLRVEAEVDEFDGATLRVGAPVRIYAEGYDDVWTGRVESIPRAVTPRRLKPQDPSKPTDTRVLLVKIKLDASPMLRFGQRVEVAIESVPAAPDSRTETNAATGRAQSTRA